MPLDAMTAVAKAGVLLVDDHSLLRTGVANIINKEPDLWVVAEAANGVEAIEAYGRYLPDVTLLDLRMPEMEGVEAVRRIRERPGRAGHRADDVRHRRGNRPRAAGGREGVHPQGHRGRRPGGVHPRRPRREDLPGAAAAAKLAERVTQVQLTPRELSALRLLANGNSNKEIASALDIRSGRSRPTSDISSRNSASRAAPKRSASPLAAASSASTDEPAASLIDVYVRPTILQVVVFQRIRSTDERDHVRVTFAQARRLSPFGMVFNHQEEAGRRLEHEAPQIEIPARQTPEDQPVSSEF